MEVVLQDNKLQKPETSIYGYDGKKSLKLQNLTNYYLSRILRRPRTFKVNKNFEFSNQIFANRDFLHGFPKSQFF